MEDHKNGIYHTLHYFDCRFHYDGRTSPFYVFGIKDDEGIRDG